MAATVKPVHYRTDQPELGCVVSKVVGFKAVDRDGWVGKFRRSYRDARDDARQRNRERQMFENPEIWPFVSIARRRFPLRMRQTYWRTRARHERLWRLQAAIIATMKGAGDARPAR